jgi:hypothetical protein
MTRRTLLVTLAAAGLAAWASAHGPTAGPLAGEQLRMLRANRLVLEDLLDHGLKVSGRNTPLDRADECLKTTDRLARELRSAVTLRDGDRVAEVSDLIHQVVTGGFVPNLAQAREVIPAESPHRKVLQELHAGAATSVRGMAESIPADGELGSKGRVKAARERLTAAADAIGPPAEPAAGRE